MKIVQQYLGKSNHSLVCLRAVDLYRQADPAPATSGNFHFLQLMDSGSDCASIACSLPWRVKPTNRLVDPYQLHIDTREHNLPIPLG